MAVGPTAAAAARPPGATAGLLAVATAVRQHTSPQRSCSSSSPAALCLTTATAALAASAWAHWTAAVAVTVVGAAAGAGAGAGAAWAVTVTVCHRHSRLRGPLGCCQVAPLGPATASSWATAATRVRWSTAAPAMTASWPEWTHRPQSGTGGTTWQDTQIQVLTAAAAAAATWPVQQASIRGYRWTHCRLWLLLLQRRLPVAKSSAAAAARLKTPWLQAHRSRARPAQDTDD